MTSAHPPNHEVSPLLGVDRLWQLHLHPLKQSTTWWKICRPVGQFAYAQLLWSLLRWVVSALLLVGQTVDRVCRGKDEPAIMVGLFPSAAVISQNFMPASCFFKPKPEPSTPHPQKRPIFPAWSAADTVKDKAQELGAEASREFNKASQAAQAKAGKIELYSGKYYAACTVGGILACGTTHTAVTPLDLIKCRRQVDSKLYVGNLDGFRKIYRAEGLRGIFTGWGPTFVGYSVQGAGKYGFYEYFKHLYSTMVGEETAAKYKTVLYLAASASAEFIADVGLCPFEAVKVRIQTTIPPTFTGTMQGINYITAREGTAG